MSNGPPPPPPPQGSSLAVVQAWQAATAAWAQGQSQHWDVCWCWPWDTDCQKQHCSTILDVLEQLNPGTAAAVDQVAAAQGLTADQLVRQLQTQATQTLTRDTISFAVGAATGGAYGAALAFTKAAAEDVGVALSSAGSAPGRTGGALATLPGGNVSPAQSIASGAAGAAATVVRHFWSAFGRPHA